jgi:hypothetical protein
MLTDQRVSLDDALADHRPQVEMGAIYGHHLEPFDGPEVNEDVEASQPQCQHGEEALPPGQESGVVAPFCQEPDRVGDGRWSGVAERGRLHRPAS